MKIGILTFHNIPNIGAILQAYSLCMAFRRMDVKCDLIDYTCINIEKRELKPPVTGSSIKDFIIKHLIWPKSKKKIDACERFMEEQHVFSPDKYNKDTLKRANYEYDAFISGSDMIWNLNVTGHDWTYFCDFVSSSKRIYAYGSSIGGNWDAADLINVKTLLSRYRFIGVRESDTCDTLSLLGLEASLVCDPTMLLTREEWERIAQPPKEKKYVLVYFPSSKNLEAAKKYARLNNLKVLVLNWALPIKGVNNVAPLSPAEWIGLFQYASAVFTGSFHGLLFSFYFKKPVWTDNKSNRIMSILTKLNTERTLLDRDPELSNVIDYNEITNVIEEFRTSSLSFIDKIVEDCKS